MKNHFEQQYGIDGGGSGKTLHTVMRLCEVAVSVTYLPWFEAGAASCGGA